MELFAKIVDRIQPFTIFAKLSILVVSHGYEYAYDKTKHNPGMCHLFHKKLGLQSLQISSIFKFNLIFTLFPCDVINHKFNTRVFVFKLLHQCS